MHEVALEAVNTLREIEHLVPVTRKVNAPFPEPPEVTIVTLVLMRFVRTAFVIVNAACWASEKVKVFEADVTEL